VEKTVLALHTPTSSQRAVRSTATVTQILIADDHGIVRKGLRTLLEHSRGCEVCAEVSNGREAVEKARLLRPDIAILDITMPVLNGVEATRQIRKVSPHTEVLILSMHESDLLLKEGLEAGAKGYLLKEDADRYLLAAVNALRRHTRYFSPKVSEALAAEAPHADKRKSKIRGYRLTPREREVVQLLAEGGSNKEVATLLDISAKTVETHRANIMVKLNLHSITELVRYAIRNNLTQS
jgi:DNA-binding NarL/FixJ family response regulator